MRLKAFIRSSPHNARMIFRRITLEVRWIIFLLGFHPRSDSNVEVVVSVATKSDRFSVLGKTLRSILAQRKSADRVLVWLDTDDFLSIPPRLFKYKKYNVEYCESKERLGPYTKLFPALLACPDCLVVTADDDVNYHFTWLADLIAGSMRHPHTIVGLRAVVVPKRSSDGFAPYVEWQDYQGEEKTDDNILLTGVGGIAYPPGALGKNNALWDSVRRLSPRNDDLGYYVIERLNGLAIGKVPSRSRNPLTWKGSQDDGLWQQNVMKGANDQQFAALWNELPWE